MSLEEHQVELENLPKHYCSLKLKNSIFKVGLNKKIIRSREKFFNLVKESIMPHPVKGLSFVQKNCCTVMFRFHALDQVNSIQKLVGGGVLSPKSKLVIRNDVIFV